MDASDLLKAVRRRWTVVAATMIVALVAGWFSTTIVATGAPATTFEATSILFDTRATTAFGLPGSYNLKTVAAFATIGDVPERAAERLGFDGEPRTLASTVKATANQETGILRITATSTNANEAKRTADVFSEELVNFLGDRTAFTASEQREKINTEIKRLQKEVTQLDQQIARSSGGRAEFLRAQQTAAVGELTSLYTQRQALAANTSGPISLIRVQEAAPRAVDSGGFIQVRSWVSRLILAGLLGLLAGIGLVFVLERFDTRIRKKESAEEIYDLPVLAEVPLLPKRVRRTAGVVVATKPKSVAADSYRLLAAGIARRPEKPPQVIMVTSAGPGEGKSTAVANLAATFAEVGRKVLVISTDLHRPYIHTLLGVPNTKGLSDFLAEEEQAAAEGRAGPAPRIDLNGHVWRTPITNVRLIPSGPPPENPAELLSSDAMVRLIRYSRELADVVLLDTPPILSVSDSAALLPEVDAVVVTAWVGKTTVEAARRTREVLQRLGADVVGVALVGTTETPLPRGYYTYYRQPSVGRRDNGGRKRQSAKREEPTSGGL